MNVDYQALLNYLRSSNAKDVFLPIQEIEKIIQSELPIEAKTKFGWWKNRVNSSRTQSWLSCGYKTVEIANIPFNNYVHFQKYKRSLWNRVRYSRPIRWLGWVITVLIIPLLLSFVAQSIIDRNKVYDTYSIIETKIAKGDYQNIEDDIYSVLPYIEKHNDYLRLCQYYYPILKHRYEDMSGKEYMTSLNEIELLFSDIYTCAKYAIKADSRYYITAFSNLAGMIPYDIYNVTFDNRCAYEAARYFNVGVLYANDLCEQLVEDSSKGKDLSVEQIDFALEVLTSIWHEGNLCMSRIQNNSIYEIAFDKTGLTIDKNVAVKYMDIDHPFYYSWYCVISADKLIEDLIDSFLSAFFNGSDILIEYRRCLENPAFYNSSLLEDRYLLLLYVLSRQYGMESLKKELEAEKIDINTLRERLIRTEEYYNSKLETACASSIANIDNNRHKGLAEIYYHLAQVNYYDYFYENSATAEYEFRYYLQLYKSVCGEGISFNRLERDFQIIAGGYGLDSYIEQLEEALQELSLEKTPALFGYASRDLATHYKFRVVNMIRDNSRKEAVLLDVQKALHYYQLSLLFYNANNDQAAYDSVCDSISLLEWIKEILESDEGVQLLHDLFEGLAVELMAGESDM